MDNDNDSFSSSSSESWGERLMNSIKGVGIGFLLFIISFVVLWWNEGRSVHTYKSLKEGKGATIEAKADTIDATLDNRLIHVSGPVTNEETLIDSIFAVEAPHAIVLKRTVQMYQWQENCESKTEKNLGGSEKTTTHCNYKKVWADQIDSSSFKKPQGHENPQMRFESGTIVASEARLGAYKLPKNLASRLSTFSKIELNQSILQQVSDIVGKPGFITSMGIVLGENAETPQVGDYRVSFETVEPTDASVIAVQQNSSFATYRAKAGDEIYMIHEGVASAEQMYKEAESSNAILTWILRFAGWLAMTIGLAMLFGPFITFLDVLPLLGSIFGFGVGLAAAIISFALSLTIIAVAWLFYRPVLSLILIAVVIGVVLFYRYWAAQKRDPAAQSR